MGCTGPTARTLAEAGKLGFTAGVVEKWIPHTRQRKDLFGCIDIIACRAGVGVLGIQATSRSNHSARRKKAAAIPELRAWLESGARFEVWSFAKRRKPGITKKGEKFKTFEWELWREELTADDLTSAAEVE